MFQKPDRFANENERLRLGGWIVLRREWKNTEQGFNAVRTTTCRQRSCWWRGSELVIASQLVARVVEQAFFLGCERGKALAVNLIEDTIDLGF